MWLKVVLALIQLTSAFLSYLERERWKAEGKREANAEAKAANDALQAHYDEIDARPSSLDDAVSRLRNRSGSGDS